MKIKFFITDIEWDTKDDEFNNEQNLPNSITVDIDVDEGEDEDEKIADWLSDEYGYCVNNFSFEKCGGNVSDITTEDDILDKLAEACAAKFPYASRDDKCVIIADIDGGNWKVCVSKIVETGNH